MCACGLLWLFNSVSICSMRLTCQGKSAPLSSSQRFKGLMQLWNLRIWTQTWRVSLGCGIINVIYDLKFKAVTLRCCFQILLLRRIGASTLCILVVSEVAMESSPGPSTSSGCRSESDHRPQSCPSNTPRAGSCCSYIHLARLVILIIVISVISGYIGMQCIPQRAALLKSMLNFLKKAIQDPAFSDGIRHGESLLIVNRRPVMHLSQS